MQIRGDAVREFGNRPIEQVFLLRMGKDGAMELLDEFGLPLNSHGKVGYRQVEITHQFEGVTMHGTGRITGNGQMSGSCSLKFQEPGFDLFDEDRVVVRRATWSLEKKQ
jgi:hypothetical protein